MDRTPRTGTANSLGARVPRKRERGSVSCPLSLSICVRHELDLNLRLHLQQVWVHPRGNNFQVVCVITSKIQEALRCDTSNDLLHNESLVAIAAPVGAADVGVGLPVCGGRWRAAAGGLKLLTSVRMSTPLAGTRRRWIQRLDPLAHLRTAAALTRQHWAAPATHTHTRSVLRWV